MNATLPTDMNGIRRAIEDKIIETLLTLEAHYKKPLAVPTYEIKPRLGRAGGYAEKWNNKIVLNQDLMNEKHWNDTLNVTVPHEICHLVAPVVYNRWSHGYDKNSGWGHGRTWKECMRVVGLEPNRCMEVDLETSAAIRLRTVARNYVYQCGCGKTFNLTKILHNRIQAGRGRRCLTCHTSIVYKGEKMNA